MSNTKILIVEDNITISKNLKRYLELKNFEAEIVDSAENADKILEDKKFDLILLDI
jgi:DNA-binding response OmpR family regulator